LFLFAFIFFRIKGKDIVISKLKESLHREVAIKDISLSFPLVIKVKNIEISGFTKIDYLSMSTSLIGFLSGKLILNNVTLKNPLFIIERLPNGSLNLPIKNNPPKVNNPNPKNSKNNFMVLPLSVDITGGRVLFKDKSANIENFVINGEDIDLHIVGSSLLPNNLSAKFKVSAVVYGLNPNKKGNINADGWVNFIKKNMDAEMNIEGLDCSVLVPYVGNFLPAERINKGTLLLKSTLKAKNNDLTIDSHLEIADLAKAIIAEENLQGSNILSSVLIDMLKGETDKVALDFVIKTKLDKPRLDRVSIKTSLIEDLIRKNITEPLFKNGNPKENIEKIGETLKGIGKIFKEKVNNTNEGKAE
jgi:hypothetical protein